MSKSILWIECSPIAIKHLGERKAEFMDDVPCVFVCFAAERTKYLLTHHQDEANAKDAGR